MSCMYKFSIYVSRLKSNHGKNTLLTRLLDTWLRQQNSDQAVLVEAVEQLMVNADLSGTTMKALQEATEKIRSQTDFSHIHALVLVENKFLSLYSRYVVRFTVGIDPTVARLHPPLHAFNWT